MGARSKTGRNRRLERWQVLLAALVAGVATIVVAFIARPPSGAPVTPSSGGSATPSSGGPVRVAITGLSERSYPPPPGRLYEWKGTVQPLVPYASVFVIAKRPVAQAAATEGQGSQPWLVSPKAVILSNGTWTITWVIRKPPSAVQWTAVVWIQYPQAESPCANCTPPPPGSDLSSQGPHAPEVIAATTYRRAPTH